MDGIIHIADGHIGIALGEAGEGDEGLLRCTFLNRGVEKAIAHTVMRAPTPISIIVKIVVRVLTIIIEPIIIIVSVIIIIRTTDSNPIATNH